MMMWALVSSSAYFFDEPKEKVAKVGSWWLVLHKVESEVAI